MSGVHPSFLSRLESGEIGLSRGVVSKISVLASALGVPSSELVAGELATRFDLALKRARKAEEKDMALKKRKSDQEGVVRTRDGDAYKRDSFGRSHRREDLDATATSGPEIPPNAIRTQDGAVYIRDHFGRARRVR